MCEVREGLKRDHPEFEGNAEFFQYYCFDSQTVAKDEEQERQTRLRLEAGVDKEGFKALADGDFAAFAADNVPIHGTGKPRPEKPKVVREKTEAEKKTALLKSRVRTLTDWHLEAPSLRLLSLHLMARVA